MRHSAIVSFPPQPLLASNQFEVFPHGGGEWCCRRADGLVCGFFVTRECAVQFARHESPGNAQISFKDRGETPASPLRAA